MSKKLMVSDKLFEELRKHAESVNEDINEVAEKGIEKRKDFLESRDKYMFSDKVYASYPLG